MPLTYYPILQAAADKKLMGRHVNGKGATVVGLFFLVLITVAAVAAFPLMTLPNTRWVVSFPGHHKNKTKTIATIDDFMQELRFVGTPTLSPRMFTGSWTKN